MMNKAGVLTTSRFYLNGAAVMHDHQSQVDTALGGAAILKKALCAIQGRPISLRFYRL